MPSGGYPFHSKDCTNISSYTPDYDAAQKEVDARQEAYQAQCKEQFKQTIARINNGTGTCMGYMALRPNTSEPQESSIE